MKINKKYIVANGCSFTEGHNLKPISWAKSLSESLEKKLINLGQGGSGNDKIIPNTMLWANQNKDKAKDSFFIIQLTECLRYSVDIDLELDNNSIPMVFTPQQFMLNKYTNKFDNWDMKDKVNRFIYHNRFALAPFFVNITERLVNTYKLIINFINFCELNDYPYLIFDGINQHIPVKRGNVWNLDGSNPNVERFEIKVVDDITTKYEDRFYSRYTASDGVLLSMLEFLKKHKYYHNDKVLFREINESLVGSDTYIKGNDGHPNEQGSKMWADYLEKVLDELG